MIKSLVSASCTRSVSKSSLLFTHVPSVNHAATLMVTIKLNVAAYKNRIHQHDSIRDILFSSAQSVALCLRKEMLSLILGSKGCPADIYLPRWTHDKPAVLDVSVISPLQRLTLESSSMSQGHGLSIGEEHEHCAHADAC